MRHVLLVLISLLLAAGCLPDDTRKPPGRLNVTLTSDYPLTDDAQGIDTADGWHIEYDRLLVTLGEVDLRGDDCTSYNDTDYARVFDARRTGSQKVSTPYALGSCGFRFRVRPPPQDSVLGAGVTQEDLAFLRAAGSDGYAQESGSAVFVAGVATTAGASKRFAWSFRLGAQYNNCKLLADAGVHLTSDDEQSLDIALASAVFFQHLPNEASAQLRFGPFAAADDTYGDADGRVTLAELTRVPLDENPALEPWDDFGDYVYTGLVPKLPRYRGAGGCTIGAIEEGGHGPGGGGH